jgi:uncharacterized membrane protein
MRDANRRGVTRAPLSAVLAFAIVPVLFHLVIVATRHARLGPTLSVPGLFKIGFVTVSALSHWGIYTSLLLTFGLTLRAGREPLITTMARRMHGELSGEMVWYTGRVTQAWCCFFAFQLTVSVTLFCSGRLVWWSTFVNILDIPMVVTMFSAEYFCRLRLLRNPPRHSFAAILNMVTNPNGNAETKQMVPVNMAARD